MTQDFYEYVRQYLMVGRLWHEGGAAYSVMREWYRKKIREALGYTGSDDVLVEALDVVERRVVSLPRRS